MSSQTNEKAFESYVEEILLARSGWQKGDVAEWDRELALFPARVIAFLKSTHSKLWAQMAALHGVGLEKQLVAALGKELYLTGTFQVLRHGFKFYGKTFRLAYFKPAHELNAEIRNLYGKNVPTITRQVPCHPQNNDTIDPLFSVNGLPIATCDLKNPNTGQTWRQAVKQCRESRDPRAPLFKFKARALVHFAADPD
jgi:type I restriction enzyme R subunit